MTKRFQELIQQKGRSRPTTKTLTDYIKPTVLKKPDMVTIHADANDVPNKANILQKIRKVTSTIK